MKFLTVFVLAAFVAAIAPAAHARQQAPATPSSIPTPTQTPAPATPNPTASNGEPLQSVGKVGGRPYRWANGWAWLSMGDDAKISMVVGIEQGIVFSVRENWSSVAKSDQQTLVNTAERLTVGGVSFNEVVLKMDDLYLDSQNDLIPVVDGYLYVVLELKNTPAGQLKKFLEGLQKTYKAPPIKLKTAPKPTSKP